MLYLIKLVKAGYGSLKEVKEMTTREVLQALNYEKFISEYESTTLQLNKERK